MDDRGTYLTIENGHLNQKRQMYSKVTDKRGAVVMKKLKDLNITPGPGAYETNDSSVISTQYTRRAILDKTSKKNLDGSPSGAGSFTNHGESLHRIKLKRLNNLSIPTIPSRFLTPILKFDLHEKDDVNA